uniref:CUB domain-containing protein n=1 Tax=Rhodnius prolixus TaxID=13249 RepID=T1HQ54_RHOPR
MDSSDSSLENTPPSIKETAENVITKYEMEGNTAGDCDYQLLEAKSSSPAYLYSPRYPSSYPKNVRCTYTISAREGGRIKLLFEEMDLQRGDISCLLREDVVRVHDGVGPLSPVITFLCNQEAHAEILSTNESLFIEFTSTSVWPGHGFKAVYYFVHNSDSAKMDAKVGIGPAVSATIFSFEENIYFNLM